MIIVNKPKAANFGNQVAKIAADNVEYPKGTILIYSALQAETDHVGQRSRLYFEDNNGTAKKKYTGVYPVGTSLDQIRKDFSDSEIVGHITASTKLFKEPPSPYIGPEKSKEGWTKASFRP
jgi:hypothetical protein